MNCAVSALMTADMSVHMPVGTKLKYYAACAVNISKYGHIRSQLSQRIEIQLAHWVLVH